MDNRIGAVVARERKALGLTQEELARRLGVTKAAVSKWELGQSMPDAALLPSIAAQFALSIDELFDWRAHLTDAEIETCAQTAREKLAADASQGATYVRMRAREHRSCWKLLVQLASELLSAANHVAFGICQDAPDDERAQERARETMCALAEDARSLCEPVLDGCSDAELMADATRVCAASSVLTGKPTACRALVNARSIRDRGRRICPCDGSNRPRIRPLSSLRTNAACYAYRRRNDHEHARR